VAASKIKTDSRELDELCIQTIRFLSADMVQQAKSGHPGMPLGMAPAAYVLWTKFLRYNSANPRWLNRDRFILSGGHGSALLYSILHLTGYNISLDDLKKFRQLGSKTPGHPEYNLDTGIEATTGPLGQGIGNAVGMAIAQKYLAKYFNRDGFDLFNYKVYVFAGDGDIQEGVTFEACSLAGHLGLDNLVIVYDDNHISIDGNTNITSSENVEKRFEACGFNIQIVPGDGNNLQAITDALGSNAIGKPTLIKLRTHIAYGAPNLQDSEKAHGAPLGQEEIRLMKEKLGWNPDAAFVVPEEVYKHYKGISGKIGNKEDEWNNLFLKYKAKYPDLAGQLEETQTHKITIDINACLPIFKSGESIATRAASGKVLAAIMPKMPFYLSGSADLTASNNTKWPQAKDFQKDSPDGRYLRFGIREHAMGAIINGINISGLLRAYCGTFLVFSDYMKPSVRVAAISKYPSIFVWTHDSIGVGEDGPTHQPVEQLAGLRAIPNMLVFRPADANETAQSWKYILEHLEGPAALILSRQDIPVFDRTIYAPAEGTVKGAYVLLKAEKPDVLIMATGSEVELALAAATELAKENIRVQVVSVPCMELFERQSDSYKKQVMPENVRARIAIEAGIEMGWRKYIGRCGIFIGMNSFGTSAPAKLCFEKFGITANAVVLAARKLLSNKCKA
jgi:transketolase